MALIDQFALSTLTEALTTADDGTFMRRILQGAPQALIDAEAEHRIRPVCFLESGAEPAAGSALHALTVAGRGYRNWGPDGARSRPRTTRGMTVRFTRTAG